MTPGPDAVEVHLDALDLGPGRGIGELRLVGSGARGAVSFAYDPTWIVDRSGFEIDPDLRLYPGVQYAQAGGLPGVFTDAAPDRWGRKLMERREALSARQEGRNPRRLDEWDFLIGVSDAGRMGALRLRDPRQDGFLDNDPMPIPPLTGLRSLEHAAREAERPASESIDREDALLALLLAPGSSLGGARPKASYADAFGALWMAKFPSRSDRDDVGAWEYVVTRLAGRAGITVPETNLLQLRGDQHTFCARRFDRANGSRRMYASAMTMTRKRDGDDASYLDLAQSIAELGARGSIDEDLQQLFRRVVFNVLVSNRDDHLRNHGFLRSKSGWRLAPAFDLNPSPATAEHTLAINDTLRIPDISLVLETAPFYRLSASAAVAIGHEVAAAVRQWRAVVAEIGLPRAEVDLMAEAFFLAENPILE